MATPSLAMIPSAYADSKVYSVLPNNGDGDFTFNRDSSATRIGQNGLIQTVGYFGSQEVTNGSFDTDTDWNKNSNWTISGGSANCDGTSNNNINQSYTATIGKSYKVIITISSISQGGIAAQIGGQTTPYNTAIGTYTSTVTATSTDRIKLLCSNNPIGSVSFISIQEVTGDQPRLNYDISNGVVQSCPSLLLEPASTNLFPYSENFSDASWNKASSTVTLTSELSPNGTTDSVYNLTGTSANLYSSGTTGVQHTISFYIKSNGQGKDKFKLRLGNNTSIEYTATNEWVRYEFTETPTTSVFGITTTSSPNNEFDLLIWGAQLETLSYPTSYIPTNGSSQTRAAETCNGAGTSSTFNSTEGVLYLEISALADDNTDRRIFLSDGTMNNYVAIGYSRFTGNIIAEMISGGVLQTVSFGATGVTQTNYNKFAFSWGSGTMKFYVNGTQTNTESVTSPTGLNVLEFNTAVDTLFMYSNTKDIRVYNEALTDAQLQTLTTL